jgi:hypothetical protein
VISRQPDVANLLPNSTPGLLARPIFLFIRPASDLALQIVVVRRPLLRLAHFLLEFDHPLFDRFFLLSTLLLPLFAIGLGNTVLLGLCLELGLDGNDLALLFPDSNFEGLDFLREGRLLGFELGTDFALVGFNGAL